MRENLTHFVDRDKCRLVRRKNFGDANLHTSGTIKCITSVIWSESIGSLCGTGNGLSRNTSSAVFTQTQHCRSGFFISHTLTNSREHFCIPHKWATKYIAQGVYNRLLLVPIVGGACFQRHQLAAVFNTSFSVFQVTYEISHINRIGEEGDFCDAMPTYPWNVTKMAVLLRAKIKSLG